MGFKSVKNGGGMMKPGDYEVFVKSCEYTLTRNNNECIKFDFVVRADVEQEYKNKHIFKNFYPDRSTGEYNADKIGKFANSLGIEPGTDFELDDLVGRNCILHIGRFTGDDGVERECIQYTKQSATESFVQELPTSMDFQQLPEDDEVLPF